MSAPPWRMPPAVQRRASHASRARTSSGEAATSSRPSVSANGIDARAVAVRSASEAVTSSTLMRRVIAGRYAPCVAFLDTAGPRDELSPDRAWWLRVPAVLLSPRPVFFALREDDPEDVVARSEPVLLLVWLAGAASVLASPTAGGLLDNPDYDVAVFAVWTFIAGGIYGAVGYFFVRFALYGGDTFRDGGADEGAGETALLGLQLGFAAWSLGLIVLGVRVVHGWSWP